MTIDELKTKKSGLISETRSMLENVKSECRQMTDEEQMMFDNNLKEIEILKSQIEKLQDQLLEVALEKKETVDEKQEEVQEKQEETVEETQTSDTEEVNEDETQDTDNEDVNENTEEVNEENQVNEDNTQDDSDNEDSDEDNTQDEDSDKIKNKRNLNHNIMSRKLLQQEIRSAMENGSNKVTIPVESRALTVTGEGGVHDQVIETEFKSILEPLYSDSIIAEMGVTTYQNLPLADIRIPVMGAANAFWTGEVATAGETKNTFDSILLQPKRISAVYPISKQLLAQDTIGVEDAIYRDIYRALASKLQKTFLSADAGTATQPAGIFNGVTATNISSYEDLCDAEAKVDDSNVGGPKKYIMSNKAKAVVRGMIRGTNNTGMVWEHNEIDGTPVIANSDIAGNGYAFGDFSKIYMAQFGEIELTMDPYTLAAEGQIRLVINAYFDWKKALADKDVIVYGNITRE